MEVASPQIRNVATVGGNLAQHSRCWYFRHRDTVCLKKGGDLCYARNSENRYHSLFTGNDCISPVVSSLATTFAALDATAIVLRDGKETRMDMAGLYQKAWHRTGRAQFAQPRRPDFARGNPDRARRAARICRSATSTPSIGRWSVARRRRKSRAEN